MFKQFGRMEFGGDAPSGGAAALGYAHDLPGEAPSVRLAEQAGDRVWLLRRNLKRRCVALYHKLDIAHDLAEDLGSARWFRGLGVMLSLAALALSAWPDFSAVEATVAVSPDQSVRDEYRSQMIMPLALGSESGRRMGPTAAVVPIAFAPERSQINMVATLGAGDSFARMLQRAGVGSDDASRAAQMIAGQMPLGDIAAGTRFDITLGRRTDASAPRPLDKLTFRASFDLDLAISRSGGALVLSPRKLAVDATPLRIQGVVGPSLYRSARAAGASIKAVQQYLQVLDQHLSLDSDIAPSDTFDFVITYKRAAGGESETGELLYAGLERGGQPLAQLLRWGEENQFYEASGLGGQRAAVYAPVAGRLTSGYGMRRHPILGYTRMHAGVDFGAAWGSPIFAVSDGMVSWAGPHGGHGNYVRLEHGGGMGTGYGHMSKIAVASGSKVRAGQVIGYVGSSGMSTGPHLHYEAYQNGRTIDPMSVRFSVRSEVDAKQVAAFKAKLAQLRKIAPGAALQPLLAK